MKGENNLKTHGPIHGKQKHKLEAIEASAFLFRGIQIKGGCRNKVTAHTGPEGTIWSSDQAMVPT